MGGGPTNTNRRRLLASLGGALAAAALPVRGQARAHRVAWLAMAGKEVGRTFLTPFVEGMAAFGYLEGRNLELDVRWGENSRDTLERLALEALALKPDVFVTQGPALFVVRKLPGTTPVVFGNSGDPMDTGVAKSLARPGGNFTGITFLSYALVGKRVELLHEIAPKAKRLAVVSNPEHRGDAKELAATRDAAISLGMHVSHHPATNAPQLQTALAAAAAARVEALVVHPDALMVQQTGAIGEFAIRQRVPAISGWAIMADGGTLLTYGPNLRDSYRRLAYFVDRILRGAKPADIPIELPNTVELVVNLKTAKALGITVPPSVLLRADRVIV
jgi:putative tryptophan/tyrosine transport system substrate-binding protein